MIIEYKCDCGKTHIAKCRDIRFSENVVESVTDYVSGFVKAGNIAIVYNDKQSKIIVEVRDRLEHGGYKVTLFEAVNADIASLGETSELVIGIGDIEVATKISGDKSLLVLDSVEKCSPFSYRFRGIIVDMSTARGEINKVAAGYGLLMTKLLAVMDYRMYSASHQATECIRILDRIEDGIMSLFSKKFSSYKDIEFFTALSECVAQVGIYESMLDDSGLLSGYDRVAENLHLATDKKLLSGECGMLVGWYSYNAMRVIFREELSNLRYPADIVSESAELAHISGREASKVLKNIRPVGSEELARVRHILSEYRADIREKLDDIWGILTSAMQSFRRIYYDAALSITETVTLSMLSDIVSKSYIEVWQFSLPKILHLDGLM